MSGERQVRAFSKTIPFFSTYAAFFTSHSLFLDTYFFPDSCLMCWCRWYSAATEQQSSKDAKLLWQKQEAACWQKEAFQTWREFDWHCDGTMSLFEIDGPFALLDASDRGPQLEAFLCSKSPKSHSCLRQPWLCLGPSGPFSTSAEGIQLAKRSSEVAQLT